MSTSITAIRDKLITNVKHQRTPVPYYDDDYLNLAISGCERFYIDTDIYSQWDTEYTAGDEPTLSRTLNKIEQEYCLVASEIAFFTEIINYWNTMVGYTTNALSITNATKPFEFLEKTIDRKEKKLIQLFQQMTDVANMSSISEISIDAVDYDFDDV